MLQPAARRRRCVSYRHMIYGRKVAPDLLASVLHVDFRLQERGPANRLLTLPPSRAFSISAVCAGSSTRGEKAICRPIESNRCVKRQERYLGWQKSSLPVRRRGASPGGHLRLKRVSGRPGMSVERNRGYSDQ